MTAPDENVYDQKQKRRFTFVVSSEGESGQKKTFSIEGWRLVSSLFLGVFGIVTIVVAALMFTPARNLLRISSSESEQRHGREIAAIQEQVSELLHEIAVLKSYDFRLRKELGDQVPQRDSALLAAQRKSTTAGSETAQVPLIPVERL